MQVSQRLAERPFAATLSMAGAIVVLIDSRVILWPFAAVGITLFVLNLVERPLRRMVHAEVVGALVTWAFTAELFAIAYPGLIRHDRLQALPELYTQTLALSLAGLFIFMAGILDFFGKRRDFQ